MTPNLKTWLKNTAVCAVVLSLTACTGIQIPPPPEITIWSQSPAAEPIVIWSQEPTIPTPAIPTEDPAVDLPATDQPSTSPDAPSPVPEPEASTDAAAGEGTVLAQLATIKIKGRAPKTGYERALFGRGWKDPDRNGCDARNDMLRRDLKDLVTKPGTQGCVILTGVLDDPFTGKTIDFVRGQKTSNAVQIDHLVALSDAWQKGAQQMSEEDRLLFANDPLNLLAVDGPSNGSKGDSDAATWLPPNKSYRCTYVARQTAVKAKYGLWMTAAEHGAIENILLDKCPGQLVPAG